MIGDSSSENATTQVATGSSGTDGGDATTSGEHSILGGTQVIGGIDVPITLGRGMRSR